ncbi:MAG: prepilin peptidase [Proteobacteria bacterium]|nr:prepilin peptidase [Pseudomonadota bacterium]
MIPGLIEGVLVAALVGAAVSDAQSGKIPNVLTGPLLLAGLVLSTIFGQGFLFALLGAVVGFAIHFPLWVMKVERGGDAKLLIAAGAFVGWQGILEMTLSVLILYIPMGLTILIARGRLGNFIGHLRHVKNQALNVPSAPPAEVTVAVMGPLILVAAIVAMVTDWFDFVPLIWS